MTDSEGYDIGSLFRDRRLNAGIAWGFVALILIVVLEELFVGDLVSAVFGVGVVVVVLVPPARFRSPLVMLPWEVVALGSLPTVGRALSTWAPAGSVATYLAVAAVALMVAVELHAFTSVEMNYPFALLFVVVTTLATAGVWAVVRWTIDLQFQTGFIESEEALMVEFVNSTAAGVLAGILFRVYFRRTAAFEDRLPDSSLRVEEGST